MSKLNTLLASITRTHEVLLRIRKHQEIIIYTLGKDSITEAERQNAVLAMREDSDSMRDLVIRLTAMEDAAKEFAIEVNAGIDNVIGALSQFSAISETTGLSRQLSSPIWHGETAEPDPRVDPRTAFKNELAKRDQSEPQGASPIPPSHHGATNQPPVHASVRDDAKTAVRRADGNDNATALTPRS